MFKHITPPSGGSNHNDQATEPPNPRRFDERGIALQTIIIMVVLLAIAGAVAAVIISRAGTETDRLESQGNTAVYGITTASGCNLGGHDWAPAGGALTAAEKAALDAARPDVGWTTAAGANNVAYCKPKA